MCEKAHLTIANSDNSQAKTLPIKLISIVFFSPCVLPFLGNRKVFFLTKTTFVSHSDAGFICTVFCCHDNRSTQDKDIRVNNHFLLLNKGEKKCCERKIKHWGDESFWGLILGKLKVGIYLIWLLFQ